nr:conjugative transposon protein TraJ [Pedobacter sp. ASV19]
MRRWGKVVLWAIVGMVLPLYSQAQGVAGEIKSLQSVLEQLYDEMIPMCSQLIGVGRGIAGFAATFYIASRVWRHIANAEPIDFYPLFRPFVLGFCVMCFPMVLAMINGIMKPTVTGTAAMMDKSNKAVEELLKQKEEAVKHSDVWEMYVGADKNGDREKWYRYTHPNEEPKDESWFNSIGNDVKFAMEKVSYNFRNTVKLWMSEILEVLFQAAALCINTLRTFQLIVLAILGPLVFGIAVFDGFQHTLTAWIAKYLNVYLWLPVANILGSIIGKIQENMLKLDLGQIHQHGDTFFSSADAGYLIFLLIGIVGYFTVPSVAGFIVNSGGGGVMTQKVTTMMNSAASPVAGMRSVIDAKKSFDDGKKYDAGTGYSGALGRMMGGSKNKNEGGDYQHSKLSGRS